MKDPFLCPLLIPENVLKMFPMIRMGCGDKDVLRDDCFRFLLKLLKVEHNVKMIIYNELSHGYLNLDMPIVLP
jgi:hormone-sensitive lipase